MSRACSAGGGERCVQKTRRSLQRPQLKTSLIALPVRSTILPVQKRTPALKMTLRVG